MKNIHTTFLLILLAAACTLFNNALANEPAAAQPALTPEQAARTLAILKDESKRAELEQTLSAIAQATEPPAQTQPAAEATPKEEAPIALEQNGLLAQVFSSVGERLNAVADWLRLTSRTVLEIGALRPWWQQAMGEPEQRAAALSALWKLIVILGGALLAEWLLRWALKRPTNRLAQSAASRQTVPRSQSGVRVYEAADAAESGSDSSVPAARAADRYWHLLRRLPFSLAYCIFGLIPLTGFLAVSSLLLNTLGGRALPIYETALLVIGAYAATRITLAIIRLMISPRQPQLRLVHLTQTTALFLNRWFTWIVVVAVFGAALADIAWEMGATRDVQSTLSKLVGLGVHILLLIMVWRSRKTAAAAIRGAAGPSAGLSGMRAVLADLWPFLATFFIIALWLLWAAGVSNGFQRLLHFFGWSAVVVIAAGLVAIFVLGAIDRSFIKHRESALGQASSNTADRSTYQLVVHRTVSILIGVAAFIVLLQVWGIDTQAWFYDGSVGRRLASAIATIAITCILALTAWEALNLSISRRLDRWTRAGDTARATRLRTLVPILRTTLFIAIAMIVLLTALNQLGVNVAPLVAGASIIGVALGFGSQKLVQDFITGIFLLMENAMQVGDFVTVAGLSGTVEYLSIRTVRLRAGDGSLHVIPFSSVTSVTNNNRGIGNASINVNVRADSDIDQVCAAIKSVGAEMRADPKLKDLILADAEIWGIDQVNGALITIAGKIVTVDSARASVQRDFNARILARFRELGIQFSNPQQTWMVTEPVHAQANGKT
ncbi:MAG TPA: mechanosensitive ion channel domain-containing protein [Eoetvoesiella sp.]